MLSPSPGVAATAAAAVVIVQHWENSKRNKMSIIYHGNGCDLSWEYERICTARAMCMWVFVFVCCMRKLWADKREYTTCVCARERERESECMFVLWSLKSFRRAQDWIAIKSELFAVFYFTLSLSLSSHICAPNIQMSRISRCVLCTSTVFSRFSCMAITERRQAIRAFSIFLFVRLVIPSSPIRLSRCCCSAVTFLPLFYLVLISTAMQTTHAHTFT